MRILYGQLLAIQILLLWCWGGYSAGSALREEMLQKSYDFLRLLPLSPWQKLIGVAVGRSLLALALAGVTAVVQFAVGLAGEVPVFLQGQIAFVLISSTAVVWCSAVLSSVRPTKGKAQQRNVLVLLVIFLGLFAIPMMLQLILLATKVTEIENWEVSFFGLEICLEYCL